MRTSITALLALALIGATMVAVFSPASAGAAGANGPDRVYFPQTGHYLAYGFLTYWRDNGGVMTFGYPITGEMKDSYSGLTVQYFQRAVFEYHPNNPAPYQVELRLLGSEFTANKRSEAPFQHVNAATNADCTYYAVTGHRLCFGFRDYWQDHGGLAIFGYPISEEFTENGMTVQYFQRARFEYHPNNPAKYQVELGLLGEWNVAFHTISTSPIPQSSDVPTYSPSLWSVGRCYAWQLQLTRGRTGVAAGSTGIVFTFQNTSDATCTLYGYPGMLMLDSHGKPMPTSVIRGHGSAFVDVPPSLVTLPPNGFASFAISYANVPLGNQSYQTACPESSRLLVTPPNDYHQLGIGATISPCEGVIHVSSVVAGTGGPSAPTVALASAEAPATTEIPAGSGFFTTGAGNGADWALTSTRLFVTTNAGVSWSSTPLPTGVGELSNDADDATVDSSGALWLLSNQGNVVSFYRAAGPDSPWTRTSVTLSWPAAVSNGATMPTPDEISFGRDAPGVVTAVAEEEGTQSGPASLVLMSTNDGRTFQQYDPPTTFGGWSTAFTSASTGVIVGDGYYGSDRGNTGTDFRSAVYDTTNGGTSWNPAELQGVSRQQLTETRFSTPLVDGTHIYIAATLLTSEGVQRLHLYASNDGGKSFALKASFVGPGTAKGAWAPLLGVNGTNVWMLLNGSGTLYKSSNNGATWATATSPSLRAQLFPTIDLTSGSSGGAWVLSYNCTASGTSCPETDEFLATTDGGNHWQVRASYNPPIDSETAVPQPSAPVCNGPTCPPR